MIRIITIEREYGSAATAIAEKVATRLGRKLWDELLTEEIAPPGALREFRRSKAGGAAHPLYYRLLKSFALGSYEGSRGAPIEMLDADSMVRISQIVVDRAANAGHCVIVGRGSQHFLRARKDTLRFFLYASKEQKVRRLIAENKSSAEAEALVDTVDHERGAFIKEYFQAARLCTPCAIWDLGTPQLFWTRVSLLSGQGILPFAADV